MRPARLAASLGVVVTTIALTAGVASAHVTIPDTGEKGGFSTVTFKVPNERPDAGTTSIEVKLPEDHPLAFVSVQPKPGWTVTSTPRTLDEPIEAFGEEITEVIDTVTWTGGTIDPGQFDTFALSVGPLPEDVDELTFATIQTYSSGEEVAWIEATPESGEEPEHPAPVLRLVEATEGSHGSDEDATASEDADGSDDSDDALAIAALVVSIAAGLLAGGALVTARRRAT